MRKVTASMICGIIIGMIISNMSDNFTVKLPPNDAGKSITIPPVATKVEFDRVIAPGLQIVEVPPPLDIMGRHPYQCYMNGEPINIPKELVKQLVAKHGNPTEGDPNFNVHNFTGNLKMIDTPAAANIKQTAPFPFTSN
tara:strand:+ start:2473 stop:2889 length:417 start_codon:yes stop_codon:yes gene_type:complete